MLNIISLFKLRGIMFYTDWNQSLLESIGSGNYTKFNKALKYGANINSTTAQGQTALMGAIHFELTDFVRHLIKAGADVHHKETRQYETALMTAINVGRIDYIKMLISAGATVKDKNRYGTTPLMLAAKKGNLNCLKQMLFLNNNQNINDVDTWQRNALTYALENKHLKCCELLLKFGAHSDKLDKNSHAELFATIAAQKKSADRIFSVFKKSIAHFPRDKNSRSKPNTASL